MPVSGILWPQNELKLCAFLSIIIYNVIKMCVLPPHYIKWYEWNNIYLMLVIIVIFNYICYICKSHRLYDVYCIIYLLFHHPCIGIQDLWGRVINLGFCQLSRKYMIICEAMNYEWYILTLWIVFEIRQIETKNDNAYIIRTRFRENINTYKRKCIFYFRKLKSKYW